MRTRKIAEGQRTMTLGELIDAMETAVEIARGNECAGAGRVQFDFCCTTPAGLASWRGIYADLAVGWKEDAAITAVEFLDELKACVGKCFVGYKGGDYRMDRSSAVWVDKWGRYTSTRLVGVQIDDFANVVLLTERDAD